MNSDLQKLLALGGKAKIKLYNDLLLRISRGDMLKATELNILPIARQDEARHGLARPGADDKA